MAAKDNNSAARSVNPVFSLVSGTFAGAVEGFATYPIEYTKTVAQFSTKAGEKVCTAGPHRSSHPTRLRLRVRR